MASMPQRILLLLALGLWIAARILPVSEILTQPGFSSDRLLGPDSYYHLRHAQAVVEHFPQLARYDVGTHFPRGERGFNQGLHDLFLSLVLVTAGPLWFGVIGGALILALVYFLVSRAASEWAAVIAVLLLVAYPGHLRVYTSMGNCDHHLTEVLLTLLVVAGLWMGLGDSRWVWLSGVPLALFFLTWFGAPLHLGLAGGALTLAMACQPRSLEFLKPLLGSFWLTLLPLWVLAPNYQVNPRGLALAAAGSVGLVLILVMVRRVERWGFLIGAAVVSFFSFTSLGQRLFSPRELTIAEHQPIDLSSLWFAFGPLLMIYVAAVGTHYYQALKKEREFFETALISYGLALVLLWLKTLDFAYYAAPFTVMTVALEGARLRIKAVPAALLTCLLVAFPLGGLGVERPWLIPAAARAELIPVHPGLDQALTFLREETPEPEVKTTALVPPFEDFDYGSGSYGVLCDWSLGHMVAALGQRPPVFSQTLNGELAQKLLAAEESELMEYLRSKTTGPERFRYLVLTAHDVSTIFEGRVRQAGFDPADYRDQVAKLRIGEQILEIPTYGARYDQVFLNRLYFDPLQTGEHFRWVFASEQQLVVTDFVQPGPAGIEVFRTALEIDPDQLPPGQTAVAIGNGILFLPRPVASAQVWEIVEGARLVGQLDQPAELELDFMGRRYSRSMKAGAVEVRLPHPGLYRLGDRSIEVSEEAVRLGSEVKL